MPIKNAIFATLHIQTMKKKLQMLSSIITLCSASVLAACSNNDSQLLEVFNVNGSQATARLTINGNVVFTTNVYIGKNGIGKTGEGDSKTPTGTLHVVKAFGVKPNPGTAFEYIDITPTTYACDDNCEYYNQIIDLTEVNHECHGEEMYKLVPQYNYGLTTDFNADNHWPDGSNIFIHCKGQKTYTGGCIAFDEDKMAEILRRCNTSLEVRISE